MTESTKEPQYQRMVELKNEHGLVPMGLMTNYLYSDSPRNLVFLLSRYKFVSKMLSGKGRVLEIGLCDGFGSRLVMDEVGELTAIDFDPVFVQDAQTRLKIDIRCHDMVKDGIVEPGNFDAAYAIDVLEHIPPHEESAFIANCIGSLSPHGVLCLGTPSLESQKYASPRSKAGHVNVKDAPSLKKLLEEYFHHVFIFSMNDEVVHTGFYPMAQYLFAIACGLKSAR